MKIFSALYDMSLRWAKHKYAQFYLFALSFSESMFFPIPPDVMLAPMVLGTREKAWRFAAITTVASVIGGICGYFLGALLFEPVVQPFIDTMGYQDKFEVIKGYFDQYGVWVIFLAGFTPIPYKLFTITAGLMSVAFLPFVLASLIGRGMRFFLVAGILYFGGEKMEQKLRNYIDRIGWVAVVAIIAFIIAKTV